MQSMHESTLEWVGQLVFCVVRAETSNIKGIYYEEFEVEI